MSMAGLVAAAVAGVLGLLGAPGWLPALAPGPAASVPDLPTTVHLLGVLTLLARDLAAALTLLLLARSARCVRMAGAEPIAHRPLAPELAALTAGLWTLAALAVSALAAVAAMWAGAEGTFSEAWWRTLAATPTVAGVDGMAAFALSPQSWALVAPASVALLGALPGQWTARALLPVAVLGLIGQAGVVSPQGAPRTIAAAELLRILVVVVIVALLARTRGPRQRTAPSSDAGGQAEWDAGQDAAAGGQAERDAGQDAAQGPRQDVHLEVPADEQPSAGRATWQPALPAVLGALLGVVTVCGWTCVAGASAFTVAGAERMRDIALTPAELLTGRPLPDGLAGSAWLTALTPDPLGLAAAVVLILLALRTLRRSRAAGASGASGRGAGAAGRAAGMSGLIAGLLLAWAACGGAGALAPVLASAATVRFALIALAVPALAAPLLGELCGAAPDVPGHPTARAWGWTLGLVVLGALVAFTPLRDAAVGVAGVDLAVTVAGLTLGLGAMTTLVALPEGRRLPLLALLAVVAAAAAWHAVAGGTGLLAAGWYGALGRVDGPTPLDDQHRGALVALAIALAALVVTARTRRRR